jgi:hypothetical protein
VSREELKRLLIEEAKSAKLQYGLYFEDIAGGFTYTGRNQPNVRSDTADGLPHLFGWP